MSKKLLAILWLLLSLILPACSNMTPEEQAIRKEDREYERRVQKEFERQCIASGNVYMKDSRSDRHGACVSKEEMRRWIGRQFN